MANSVDPDQMLHSAASDLGLHFLQMSICPNAQSYYSKLCHLKTLEFCEQRKSRSTAVWSGTFMANSADDEFLMFFLFFSDYSVFRLYHANFLLRRHALSNLIFSTFYFPHPSVSVGILGVNTLIWHWKPLLDCIDTNSSGLSQYVYFKIRCLASIDIVLISLWRHLLCVLTGAILVGIHIMSFMEK